MAKGTLYGIGVGPGDPELLTLKGARLIRECDVVGVPDSGTGEQVALDIVRAHVHDKPVWYFSMPMTRDEEELARHRNTAADRICAVLEEGRSVAFLTIGDPTIYSTYLYVHRLVEERGFPAEMVAGVPSFCAAAAALGVPLCEAGEALHILPASYQGADEGLALPGVKVLMKSGKKLDALLEKLRERGELKNAVLAERVGLAQQRLVHNLEEMEGQPGYLSLVIVKDGPVR